MSARTSSASSGAPMAAACELMTCSWNASSSSSGTSTQATAARHQSTQADILPSGLVRGTETFRMLRPESGTRALYTVKAGDTLIGIAGKHNISWRKLYRANRTLIGSNPSLIRPGMHLHIPA